MAYRCVSQKVAQAIDVELMSSSGAFSIDQLMELAGLSVAQAVQKSFDSSKTPNVLVCVGPGNNGGDGLVAARHLHHFGFKPSLYYPKQPEKDLYKRLLIQCKNLDIPIYKDLQQPIDFIESSHIILDALFGFSFQGEVRDPYKGIIQIFEKTSKPIVSVDIPSGWDMDIGPTEHVKFQPDILVSLTAPKPCSNHFRGRKHFLGGRFVPPTLAKRFDFDVPDFPGSEQVVELKKEKN
ncbi:YjeF N-terminal domain-like protein [Cokeromyces recurvatus]|uniref:YjeF N-terminal domain-like protein n=1 Tax=Cokeromyces recurvatus TaxID=90255 RepID=UPI00221F3988|nr:YjeF N-terminal domain-like protein [Cokeromyces recurvatus]KAI7905597.1 YjeF N-terminal domain-like protein [Cokeromyces recurvatus]